MLEFQPNFKVTVEFIFKNNERYVTKGSKFEISILQYYKDVFFSALWIKSFQWPAYKTCQNVKNCPSTTYWVLGQLSLIFKKTCFKFNPVLWVHLCYIYTFGADVDFSIFFPGLEFIYSTHRVRTALMKKWTTQNCLTDVNWFSKLFYILLEKPRE